MFDYVEYGQSWLGECRHVHQLHLPVGGQHHQAGGHGGQEAELEGVYHGLDGIHGS